MHHMRFCHRHKADVVRTAEKSILEIAELRSTIAQHLDTQSVMIDQLVQDSYSTTEDVGKGNKELKRASERISWAPYVFYATAAGCSFFIFWDSIV
jgi:syntaxin 18